MLSIGGKFMCLGYLILLSNRVYGCWDKYTNWNDAGKGDPVYLDRHTVSCGGRGNVLNSFKLERKGRHGNQIRYRYKCCRHAGSECNTRRAHNRYTFDGDGNIIYLDRQTVNCANGLINEFRLSRNEAHTMFRYEYNCCELKGRLSCHNRSTGYTIEGDRNSFFLDRQNVACNGGQYLQSFRLKRSNGRMRYDIRCCRVTR